ncbi:Asparagine synthetase domain-containing protein 1 [Physocladia obscura]|uniref:Asparagine synthetase domain-containing protein 1 n=1 Tax=Physocladia obscura TaxID=109957 RepID=A0AAD5T9Z9_9FUNG|nr:Asparagine synthetase domain-containing protein 1 [Physocladia obscura]
MQQLSHWQRKGLGNNYSPHIYNKRIEHLYSSALAASLEDSDDEISQSFAEFVEMGKQAPNAEGTGRFLVGDDSRNCIYILLLKDAAIDLMLEKFLAAFFQSIPIRLIHTELQAKIKSKGRNRTSLVDKMRGFEFPLETNKLGAIDVFSLFDVLSEYLPIDAFTAIFVADLPIFDPCDPTATIGGRACGDRIAVLSTKNVSQRELFQTCAHELLHTFGVDHCEAWHCIMNPCIPEVVQDACMEPCPVDIRKIAIAIPKLDLEKRWQQLLDVYREMKWTIDVSWVEESKEEPVHLSQVQSLVARRGPDVQRMVVRSAGTGLTFALFASVLHLRGTSPVAQPLTYSHSHSLPDSTRQPYPNQQTPIEFDQLQSSSSLLAWNGELFRDINIPPGTSDTAALYSRIFGGAEEAMKYFDGKIFSRHLLHSLSTLRGPWAIFIYHAPSNTLFFGRDVLGRRSLLVRFPSQTCASFSISSVAGAQTTSTDNLTKANETKRIIDDAASDTSDDMEGSDNWWGDADSDWHEVPANGIYSICLADIDLNAGKDNFRKHLTHYPWLAHGFSIIDNEALISPTNPILNPRIPKNFDLENHSILANPNIIGNNEIPLPVSDQAKSALARLTSALSSSVAVRVQTITQQCAATLNTPDPLAILFSGGLDCMVLAALAAQHLPCGSQIDLLNVAFDNPRVRKAAAEASEREKHAQRKKTKKINKMAKNIGSTDDGNGKKIEGNPNENGNYAETIRSKVLDYPSHLFAVPDRKTGLKGFKELRQSFPHIKWRFLEIDVQFEEAQKQKSWIMGLVYPLQSVMDLSIAMAFWFAARGVGAYVNDSGVRVAYETKAKILLSGLGADEQLGGYSRHRKNFDSSGWQGLLSELQKDVLRISKRNLGRDDRIVSDHGREIRFPYLDEEVITELSSLPVHLKTDLRLPKGVGDKLLLRQLATQLGLVRASVEVKRAVQFGARTAKMTDGKEKGDMNVSI